MKKVGKQGADGYDWSTLAGAVDRWYEIPVLGAIIAFMVWVRLQAIDRFLIDGRVYYSGNDAYYHFREVMYVVTHWPRTMPFDPWSYFPYGTNQGQFGTLFDQLVATAALIVGLGSPSEHTVAVVHLVAPAIFGALVVIPTYLIGRRLGDRRTGVLAALVLAVLPGSFLARTNVGFADHHSAEILFQGIAILTAMIAVGVAEREKPVYEQLLDRDWEGLRTPLAWSSVAGLGLVLYIWIWPPAVFLVGILGIFYAITLALKYVRGESPDHVAFVGVVSMAVLLLWVLVWMETLSFPTTQISLLHALLAVGVGAGAVFMAWLARVWDERGYPTRGYPSTVAALIVVGIVAVAVGLPSLFATVSNNVLRIFAFGQTDTVLTIREAQSIPFDSIGGFLVGEYGLTFLIAAVGLGWLVMRIYRSESAPAEDILLVVWAVVTTMMAMTQVRFNYYLATVVAVLSGYFLTNLLDSLGIRTFDDVRGIETYQALTVLVVVLVLAVPLFSFVAGPSVVQAGQQTGPGSAVVWGEGMTWFEENAPQEGRYGGADNDFEYYGTFEPTEDFDYPEGTYGVMSWWDYGHWITVLGERIPNANPFQQGPQSASTYFQATNETHANLVLEALPSIRERGGSVTDKSTEELRTIVADQSPQHAQEDTRYVAIDDQMAGGKFPAIATWAGPGQDEYFQQSQYQLQGQNVTIPETNDRYDRTMLARLYFQDAGGLSHYRLVHEVDQYSIVGGYIQGQQLRALTSLPLGGDWDSIGPTASQLQQANQADQAVQIGQGSYVYNARIESRVKLYERVEGATLTGTVPEAQNETPVVAFVRLQTHTGRNFTYVQQTQTDSDGSFAMTVPYATDDGVGVEDGGANSSVRALGEYTVQAGSFIAPSASGSTAVPEEAVYAGDEIQVELEQAQEGDETAPPENATTSPGNETADDQPTGSGEQTDSGNQSDGTGGENAGSLGAELPSGEAASVVEP